jgi:ATP-dependent helicase/nuclease subunit A
MSARSFTAEQQGAIDDRRGSGLLAAAAGSGKTAVMVERFVESVVHDEVPVSSILALTFTEKAAGELRERIRRRLTELGEDEHARAVDASWVGTIHGFCARVLRAQPLAAGLDPRFVVLDEPAARRVAEAAYESALEEWEGELGSRALDVAAAYGPGLRDIVIEAHATLRSRGESHPRIPLPPEPPAPDPGELLAARAAALAELERAGDGARVRAGLEALAACAAVAGEGLPWPGELEAATLKRGAKALESDACEAYREAFTAYRQACADRHARAALEAIDALLDRYGRAYAGAKAARAGLDFEDLELRVRDLLADESRRRRWAERFAVIMVDEFQDTNRLQLELLEALERDNLFAVGDEFQSIYRFRHADVTIFRERRARLGEKRVRRLSANFRSAEELLDVLNGAFSAELGSAFGALRAGHAAAAPAPAFGAPRAGRAGAAPAVERDPHGALRLFDLDPPAGAPPVELLVTDHKSWDDAAESPGLGGLAERPWRAAEARLVAHRLRAEATAGRRPGDMVVLVRATASLRLFEQALEEQGLPTYVVGGRGYWTQEQVRDGIAWLAALANPREEEALLAVLASPFCGAGTDALVLAAEEGRRTGAGLWGAIAALAGADGEAPDANRAAPDADGEAPDANAAASDANRAGAWAAPLPPAEREKLARFATVFAAERAHAERLPVEVLLERGISATGYDLAILARAGGDRRLANLRKLMRLARDHERAEGRDLRGFLAYAAGQDVTQAREGEAALESEGLDAVRLMTIHRAKGLEFPVVCVADLGRAAGGARARLLVGADGSAGLRLRPVGGGDAVPALAWQRLADAEEAAEAEEERRLFYVAMTRARDLLILSGGVDTERWPAPRPGGPPLDWIVRALVDHPAERFRATAPDSVQHRSWDGRPARLRCALNAPATLDVVLPRSELAPAGRPTAARAHSTALPAAPRVLPAPPRPRPTQQRLSYTALQDYARCGYRFYLQRILRLPDDPAPPDPGAPLAGPALDARERGSLVHILLERLDFADPRVPDGTTVAALAESRDQPLEPAEIEDLRALVAAFAGSPLRARLAAARRVRREAPFAFTAGTGGDGPLVRGVLDVLAEEPDGTLLVVDYKSDRLAGAEPGDVVERDYATQRTVYALAALEHGAPRVEVAHVFLERPAEPSARTYAASDAAALTEQLLDLGRGILDERWPVTATPHRELCADCPGRRTLCSWPERVTLQSSAGSLAGISGPS